MLQRRTSTVVSGFFVVFLYTKDAPGSDFYIFRIDCLWKIRYHINKQQFK